MVLVPVPLTVRLPPTFAAPPMPTPPVTTRAPVLVEDEAVELVTAIVPDEVVAPVRVGEAIDGEFDSTSLPVPVFGETSVGGMMTEGMEMGGLT